MTVESFVSGAAPSRRRTRWEPRLVAAELLKLRKRRGLVVSSLVLTVAPMILGYTIVAVLHTTDPAGHGPAGGSENFVSSIGLLSALVAVVSIVIGVTAGTGDLRAGVFRELVLTGRSRLSLFGARVPAGLAFLLPLVALAYAVAAGASFALAGDLPTPDARLVALAGGWVALHATLGFVLGLGVSSVIGSAGPSIALILGWQFVVAPLVLGLDGLGLVRDLLPGAAALALSPDELAFQPAIAMPPALASTSLLLWAFVPLAAGAWVTSTRDA